MQHRTKGYSQYGASMGRGGERGDPQTRSKFRLVRVRIDSGGYDPGGAYWGLGQPLYEYESESGESGFLRAHDRAEAKATLRARYPNAKIGR